MRVASSGGWGGFVGRTGPGPSWLVASVCIHVVAFAAFVFFLRLAGQPRIQPATYIVAQISVEPIYLPQSQRVGPGHSQPQGNPAHITRSRQQLLSRQLRLEIPDEPQYTGQDAVLQQQARRWTSDITRSLNFHGVYLNHVYQLAVLVSGDLPVISESELPPHFQSYVIIEVTIDEEGRPAHVHTVAGIVTPKIEEKLLAAIRQFRYIPAKRDGLPIPSQRDIVIHIPT
ncbi:MAG TPA: energy transducer TonB [Candidatus Angelobacter sp.]